MPGTVTYLGSESVGNIVPTLSGVLSARIPELTAQLGGAQNVGLALTVGPPSIAATLVGATLQLAALAASISGPTITLQAGPLLLLIASLQAEIGALNATLGVLGTAGIHLYSYSGDAASMGAAISGATSGGLPDGSGPAAFTNALLLATTLPAAWAALGTVVKTV